MFDLTSKKHTLIQVFLVNSQDEVFVCKTHSSTFTSHNICAEGHSIEEALMNIEEKWGVLCEKGNLIEIFWLEQLKRSEIVSVNGFMLRISLTNEIKEFMAEKCHCEFVYYRDLVDQLKKYKINSNLKESIMYLVGKLEGV